MKEEEKQGEKMDHNMKELHCNASLAPLLLCPSVRFAKSLVVVVRVIDDF